MGCINSRQKSEEMLQLQDIVARIDGSITVLVHKLDGVRVFANEFVLLLEDKAKDSRDTDLPNVERLYQRIVQLYGTAVRLLLAFEACNETKHHTIEQINGDLHLMNTGIEKLCKAKFKRLPEFSSDSYLRQPEERGEHVSHQPNSERARKVMSETVDLLTIKTDWQLRVQKLETDVLKMAEELNKMSLENSAKGLRLKKPDEDPRSQVVHTNADNKTKENRLLQENTIAQTTVRGNEALVELRIATNHPKQEELKEKLERQNDVASKRIGDLEQELIAVRNQLELEKANNIHLCAELDREKDRFTSEMQSSVSNLEKDKQMLQMKVNDTEENAKVEIKSLESFNQKLQKTNCEMELEIKTLKSKTYLQVQIYSQQRGDLMDDIENELMALVKSKMNNSITEVDFIKCLNISHIQSDKSLVILCINTSRLGTGATSALNGIKVTSNMALLVFHHKDVHALPSQASDRVLSGPEFKDLGGIFDMAFLSEKGIYPCEMNNNSIIHVQHFIRQSVARK